MQLSSSGFLESIPSWIWPVLAALGGGIVLIGLWMEYTSKIESPDLYKNINDFWSLKSRNKWGEIWVMIGIGFEIVIGIIFAFKEESEAPLNQPISLISAVVRFNVASDGKMHPPSITNENWGSGISFFNGTNINQQVFELDAKNTDVDIGNIVGTNGNIVGGGAEYLITFHQNLLLDMPGSGALAMPPDAGIGKSAKSFGEVGSFVLSMPQISSNTEVLSGSIFVTINSSLNWVFDIPPQKQRFGLITGAKIKTADNKVATEVFPITILTLPSNTTNFFDGK